MLDRVDTIYFLQYKSKESMEKGLNFIKDMKVSASLYFDEITDIGISSERENTVIVRCKQYLPSVRAWKIFLDNKKEAFGIKGFESYVMYLC
jgi:hypothetical protein